MGRRGMTDDEETNNLRRAAGNPMKWCPICGRKWDDPRLMGTADEIKEGCVDAFHMEHAVPGTPYGDWYHRQEARNIRRAMLEGFFGPF